MVKTELHLACLRTRQASSLLEDCGSTLVLVEESQKLVGRHLEETRVEIDSIRSLGTEVSWQFFQIFRWQWLSRFQRVQLVERYSDHTDASIITPSTSAEGNVYATNISRYLKCTQCLLLNLLKYVDELDDIIIKPTPWICAQAPCCYAPDSSMHDHTHSALEVIEGISRPSFWNSTHRRLDHFSLNVIPAASNISSLNALKSLANETHLLQFLYMPLLGGTHQSRTRRHVPFFKNLRRLEAGCAAYVNFRSPRGYQWKACPGSACEQINML